MTHTRDYPKILAEKETIKELWATAKSYTIICKHQRCFQQMVKIKWIGTRSTAQCILHADHRKRAEWNNTLVFWKTNSVKYKRATGKIKNYFCWVKLFIS